MAKMCFVPKFLGMRLRYPVGYGRCTGDDFLWDLQERESKMGMGICWVVFAWVGADVWD